MDGNLAMANQLEFNPENPMGLKSMAQILIELDARKRKEEEHRFGTMEIKCEHEIEKLYNKAGDYKADYCIKCKGIY